MRRLRQRDVPHYGPMITNRMRSARHVRKDRQRGTIIGLAIGDALGAAVEFEMPGTFPEVTGYRGDGPHRLKPGQWTDDTSMALALADSIASVGWDFSAET